MTKKPLISSAFILLLLAAAHTALAQSAATAFAGAEGARHGSKTKIFLDSGWRFREAGKGEWRAASVPGCVHTDLLANKLIEDPFYRDDEPKLQWIGKSNWEYRTTFDVSPDVLKREHVELVFEGLDTYATVTLNGSQLLEADNMFRTWRVDAKHLLRPGANTLDILFRSPINEVLPVMAKMGYQLPASNDQGEKTSPLTRKAPYQYGWDWGPRFVTSGVWRPVSLEAWDTARVESLRIVQNKLDKDSAQLTAEIEVVSTGAADAVVVVEDVTDRSAPARQPVKLAAGVNKLAVNFNIASPRLWWPNGMGDHPLYDLRARLVVGGKEVDERAARVGLRTVELRQQPDADGKSFTFVVNGVPVFAKGANWIPADSFPTRITRERYRQLIESARDANMNMLRVWGGGIYESDDFYDACDEMGLLVWQEFMFACSMYPGDKPFLENVRAEAVDNVKRLRNHPSIVLWCGNNEVETAWQHWGWKQNLPASLWDDYKKIFHGVLPEVVAEYDPARPYWPSSPSSNLEDDPDSQKMGDVHYWQVWHAAAPFTEYEKQHPRFMSEYGFQSFPSIETVNAYTLLSDHDIQSPVMLAHQKHPRGNQLIREYMLREYPEPKDFDSFLYVSQVLQAEGIRVGAEHLRRIMPHNMGSLFWQLDDCWPVASWSSIDYYGRWKALQYYARRFYAPLLVSPRVEDASISFYVVSDETEATTAELVVTLMDFDGRALSENRKTFEVAPLASRSYLGASADELLRGHDPKAVFLNCELLVGGKTVSSNRVFFRPFKELTLPAPHVSTDVARTRGGFAVTVKSDKFARAVYLSAEGLDGSFADNYFDLIPGSEVRVEFRASRAISPEEFRTRLRARTLADAFVGR
ncbi:MAG TPA: glycoside hydrolase family 2 protein [Pyrinomonadaceae bacterium]|nr:glycoside hydrolase family 2 protein [Pyrinomonadaceae bacterium]